MTLPMKMLGLVLLLGGFLWIGWDCAADFVIYQHGRWMWQSQHLSAGDTIKRDEAIGAMRDLSIALKDRHRRVLLPAFVMFAGGFVSAFAPRSKRLEERIAEPGASPNGGPAEALGNSGVSGGPPSVS